MIKCVVLALTLIMAGMPLSLNAESKVAKEKPAMEINEEHLKKSLKLIKEKYQTTLTKEHLRRLIYYPNSNSVRYRFYLGNDKESSEIRFIVVIENNKIVHHEREEVD